MADEDALHAAGKDAVGITFVHEYSAQLPMAATQQFVKDWKQAYNGQIPSYWGESTYTMAQWIDKAISAHRTKTGHERRRRARLDPSAAEGVHRRGGGDEARSNAARASAHGRLS